MVISAFAYKSYSPVNNYGEYAAGEFPPVKAHSRWGAHVNRFESDLTLRGMSLRGFTG